MKENKAHLKMEVKIEYRFLDIMNDDEKDGNE